jgi:DNA-binding MarR family transcriptional regulator
MAIKKRKSLPQDEAAFASEHDEDKTTARHPSLSGLRQDVYMFVDSNQPCTRADVARGISLSSSTTTARIKELIDEGFLIEPPDLRKMNSSGVKAKCLMVTDRQQGGSPLDKVRVELTLTIDCDGTYGIQSRVVGGMPQNSATTRTIKSQRVTLTAPHPDTYKAATDAAEVTTVSRHELQTHAHDIIEGTVSFSGD